MAVDGAGNALTYNGSPGHHQITLMEVITLTLYPAPHPASARQ